MKRLILAATFLFFLFYALPVFASGIIIHIGGAIKLNDQTISMNCSDLTVEDGGNLNLGQGLLENCRHFTLENGATFIDGSGDMTLCGTWKNNSSFQKSVTSTIGFVPGCSVEFGVRGTGDTDGDGVSDRLESYHDSNDDGLPDFLDSTITTAYSMSPAAIQLLLLDN